MFAALSLYFTLWRFKDFIQSLGGGGHLPAKKTLFTFAFCLFGAILDLKEFCLIAIPDIMIELMYA